MKRTVNLDSDLTTPISLDQDMVRQMFDALDQLASIVPMTQFQVLRDAQNLLLYTYTIQTLNGRVWQQTLTFANQQDTDPYMTFNVVQGWKLSEFALQRPVRDSAVAILLPLKISRVRLVWG